MKHTPRSYPGRTRRGQTRQADDQLTLIIPLTVTDIIDEDEFTRILTILLHYAPYARDPARFRPLLAAAILNVSTLTPEP